MGIVQYGLPFWSPLSPYPIRMVEPYNSIVFNNISAWNDPSAYSDIDLAVRKANAQIVNTVGYANYMQNSGLTAPPTNITIFGQELYP